MANERTTEMARLYTEDGLTLEQIAERYGLHLSRVHAILKKAGVPTRSRQQTGTMRKARAEAAKADAQLDELLRRMANAKPCVVCGAWVLRGSNRVTCSSGCSEVWEQLPWKQRVAALEANRTERNPDD